MQSATRNKSKGRTFFRHGKVLEACRGLLQEVLDTAASVSSTLYSVAVWILGRIQLLQLEFFSPQSDRLLRMFRTCGVSFASYTAEQAQRTSCIYLRFSTNPQFIKFVYLGATASTVLDREHTRKRKFQQVLAGQLVNAEPAIRWWAQHCCFQQFVAVPIIHSVHPTKLDSLEAALIQLWQPKLNHPFVEQFFQKTKGVAKLGFALPNSGLGSLFLKIRRRRLPLHLRTILQHRVLATKQDAWQILTDLSANTRRSFDKAAAIRAKTFPIPRIQNGQNSSGPFYAIC
jgi:hypothetical protein